MSSSYPAIDPTPYASSVTGQTVGASFIPGGASLSYAGVASSGYNPTESALRIQQLQNERSRAANRSLLQMDPRVNGTIGGLGLPDNPFTRDAVGVALNSLAPSIFGGDIRHLRSGMLMSAAYNGGMVNGRYMPGDMGLESAVTGITRKIAMGAMPGNSLYGGATYSDLGQYSSITAAAPNSVFRSLGVQIDDGGNYNLSAMDTQRIKQSLQSAGKMLGQLKDLLGDRPMVEFVQAAKSLTGVSDLMDAGGINTARARLSYMSAGARRLGMNEVQFMNVNQQIAADAYAGLPISRGVVQGIAGASGAYMIDMTSAAKNLGGMGREDYMANLAYHTANMLSSKNGRLYAAYRTMRSGLTKEQRQAFDSRFESADLDDMGKLTLDLNKATGIDLNFYADEQRVGQLMDQATRADVYGDVPMEAINRKANRKTGSDYAEFRRRALAAGGISDDAVNNIERAFNLVGPRNVLDLITGDSVSRKRIRRVMNLEEMTDLHSLLSVSDSDKSRLVSVLSNMDSNSAFADYDSLFQQRQLTGVSASNQMAAKKELIQSRSQRFTMGHGLFAALINKDRESLMGHALRNMSKEERADAFLGDSTDLTNPHQIRQNQSLVAHLFANDQQLLDVYKDYGAGGITDDMLLESISRIGIENLVAVDKDGKSQGGLYKAGTAEMLERRVNAAMEAESNLINPDLVNMSRGKSRLRNKGGISRRVEDFRVQNAKLAVAIHKKITEGDGLSEHDLRLLTQINTEGEAYKYNAQVAQTARDALRIEGHRMAPTVNSGERTHMGTVEFVDAATGNRVKLVPVGGRDR